MTMEIREVYGEEALRYAQLCCVAFHSTNDKLVQPEDAKKFLQEQQEKNQLKIGPRQNSLVRICAMKDQTIIAGMEIVPFAVNFDGNICDMGGIGGVLSDPETRRTGAIRAIFQKVFEKMRENGQYLSHLNPFTATFYRKFGYEMNCERILWKIPIEYLPVADNEGIVRYVGTEGQREDVKRVYEAYVRDINMAVAREDCAGWKHFFEEREPYGKARYAYLHYNSNGDPDGFLCYAVKNLEETPMILDATHGFYFSNVAGLRALLSYAATYGSYASKLQMYLPPHIDITSVMPELVGGWGKKNIIREIYMDGMSRVVDVKEVLRLARYKGKGTVCIAVRDSCCPWNNGSFRVEFDGRASLVEEGGIPDIEMDIKAFSVMILGRFAMEQWEYLPDVSVHGNTENLEKVFYKKPIWMEDHF